ncbi:hypothetical protein OAX78_01370 [Planctomycetota bacterium]|nr:hypothetical protein [Planctomycetota bacterium]
MTTKKRFLRNSLAALALGGAVTAGALTVRAQDAPPERPETTDSTNSDLSVLKTEFLENYNRGQWREAVDKFREMERDHGSVRSDRLLFFKFATAQLSASDHGGATTTLESLLENLQEDHVEALFLLAKIKAKHGDDQDKERAKDLLLQAARAGQFVLRDIASTENAETFAYLVKDPGFILRVMNASQDFQVQAAELRNPFSNPQRFDSGDAGDVAEPGVVGSENDELAGLEQAIDDLFEEIIELARQRQVEELIAKFRELRNLMTAYGEGGGDVVKAKLRRYEARLQDLGEVRLSIKLQVFINEGNEHLKTMADSIRSEEYDVALARFEEVKELCELMRAEEREVFHRNAEALFLRAKGLADRATILKRIQQFSLPITGIIVAPSDQKDRAIIDDRIYEEGDAILDSATEEEIEGLRVVEILRSTVRFRYEDTEFVRELRQPR